MKKAAKKAVRRKKKAAAGSKATEPVNLQELRERVRHLVAEQTEEMTKADCGRSSEGSCRTVEILV